MFRVGLIGCGSISTVHAQVLSGLENTELVCCADVIRERAERYNRPAYTDWKEMLKREKPDAVHICAPHWLHPVMATEAAKQGIAVFTKKPPAIDAAGWEQVKQAAEHVPVGICFQNRYHPHVGSCRRFLEGNTYGRLLGIRGFVTWNRTKAYYDAADWKGNWATEGGGVLINQAIHTLDLMIVFLGMLEQAEMTTASHRLRGVVEVEDTAEIYLRRGEIPALLYASNGYSMDAPVMIELHLEQAVIRLETDSMTVIRDGNKEEFRCEMLPAPGRSYWGTGHIACIADFYRCMETGETYGNAPAFCDDTMRTLLQLYENIRPNI